MELNTSDFLNAAAQHPNFLTGKPWSNAYKSLAAKWSNIPVYTPAKVKEIIESILNNPVNILVSATGSGKSVLVPKIALKLLHHLNATSREKVAMTIPKRMAVLKAAEYSAATLNVQLGEEVDFGYRGKKASGSARLVYVTDGILLAKILHGDVLLKDYRVVILDEVHEKAVPTDILLYFLRAIVKQRPEFRVMLMSATIDPQPYIDYFHPVAKANVIMASGTTSEPIEQVFLSGEPSKPNDALKVAVDNALNVINNTSEGDMLIFVPRIKDTLTGCAMLRDQGGSKLGKVLCISLHSGTEPEDSELATHKSKYKERGYSRRVIFATNAAESSITIDGLQYVFDTGLEVQVTWDAKAHATSIAVDYTSQSQIKQRMGRVGRTQPGVVYHLYSEQKFKSLPVYPTPNISKIEITDQFLLMASHFSISDVIQTFAGLLTPPSVAQVVDAMSYLHYYGLISVGAEYDQVDYSKIASYKDLSKFNGAITPSGTMLLQAQEISPDYALLLFWGAVFGCVSEMIILACILETVAGEVSALWSGDGLSNAQKRKVAHKTSDHISLINVYKELYLKGKRPVPGLSSQWSRIQNKASKFYKIHVEEAERSSLVRRAAVESLDPVSNAILAARGFNLADIGGKGMMTNMYPVARTSGRAESPFGMVPRGSLAVYESLTISARGPTFQLLTCYPSIKVSQLQHTMLRKVRV